MIIPMNCVTGGVLNFTEEGGFEKIKKTPGKIGRQDSKRISKKERKEVKKKRKQQKEMEKVFDNMDFV